MLHLRARVFPQPALRTTEIAQRVFSLKLRQEATHSRAILRNDRGAGRSLLQCLHARCLRWLGASEEPRPRPRRYRSERCACRRPARLAVQIGLCSLMCLGQVRLLRFRRMEIAPRAFCFLDSQWSQLDSVCTVLSNLSARGGSDRGQTDEGGPSTSATAAAAPGLMSGVPRERDSVGELGSASLVWRGARLPRGGGSGTRNRPGLRPG